ncbi:MAG: putative DNA modification/repair radical SAM protein [Lachnospiraceae bacterium]|nr:putative DNA modification/repair radical SAM protein [Lachnospiraceae bacterium]
MVVQEKLTLEDKLNILSAAAKFDVSCTTSGVDRGGNGKSLGNTVAAGICHAFAADGRCVSLLKVLMTNECIFECKYCINKSSNDIPRATFTPEEVAKLTMEFYRRNFIEGLFLSSGIYPTPQESMERMLAAIKLLRLKYGFRGYIHVKTIPGAEEATINEMGWFADRMSINLELPTGESLKALAPNKSRKTILPPMRFIQNGRKADENQYALTAEPVEFNPSAYEASRRFDKKLPESCEGGTAVSLKSYPKPRAAMKHFVPAGQSTQMIIGATPENDYQIMSVTEGLYQKFGLKRVFYSSFINVNHDPGLPDTADRNGHLSRTLLDREHRLYQADWLLRFYKFSVEDLLTPEKPDFNMLVDPKCDYALRHLELFPVEINRASYDMLLKVPGIGVKSALHIVQARRTCTLDFNDLKKIGVVLKRAVYFITCRDKMLYPVKMTEDNLLNYLIDEDKKPVIGGERLTYQQLNFFDLGMLKMPAGY